MGGYKKEINQYTNNNKDMTQQEKETEKQKEQEQREKAIEYHQQQKFERFLNTGSYY